MKVEKSINQKGELVGYLVTSPATDITVCFYVSGKCQWSFNGDFDNPTFTPSMLCHANNLHGIDHFFVTDGKIHYCSDCEHGFAGKTVDMIDVI